VAIFAPNGLNLDPLPAALANQPFVLPSLGTALGNNLDRWFEERDISPNVVARFDNSALLKLCAANGHGLFIAPTMVAPRIENRYNCRQVMLVDGVLDSYYAITLERQLKHPALVAIAQAAQDCAANPGALELPQD
jgi:LysR family transcriptional activator of nhaA